MQTDTNLRGAIFPVEVRDLYYDPVARQEGLFDQTSLRRLKSHRVVVDVERARPLGVVGKAYELLTNEEALDIGRRTFAQYFESVDPDSFVVYNVIMPSTRTYCHIDLVNEHYRIDRWEQDTWLPYLRVTNSYNTSRAFRLELGFLRTACSNGLIFVKSTVAVQKSHTHEDLGDRSEFDLGEGVELLRAFEAEFVAYLAQIRSSRVPRLYALPLVAQALGLSFNPSHEDPKTQARERSKLEAFRETVGPLVSRYVDELGPNAYAVLNAATDYATHGEAPRASHRSAPMQKQVGQWLREYADASRQPAFDIDAYVGPHLAAFEAAW